MNDYPDGWTVEQGAAEQALAEDLTQLVAAGQLTEPEAQEILPGYEYPELAFWVRPPADQLDPPPLHAVRAHGHHLQQHAQVARTLAQLDTSWNAHTQHLAEPAYRHQPTGRRASERVDDDGDADGI